MGKLVVLNSGQSSLGSVREALEIVIKALDGGKPIRRIIIVTEEDSPPGDKDLAHYDVCTSNLTVEGSYWLLEMGRQWILESGKA
ncbi:MAG TPA: hypothetical protein VMV27_07685 [Candidatus Binataceae bacterium]|nr:hypothetical protein [Candidatus Binataceae bacterium]